MAVKKAKRDSKTSKGTGRGAKPVRLTELEKILLVGGGALAKTRPAGAAPRRK